MKRSNDGTRLFNIDWNWEYFFTYDDTQKKPLCILCHDTVALCKKGNVKRHFETKHKLSIEKLSLTSKSERTVYFEGKLQELKNSRRCLSLAVNPNVNVMEASYQICLILAKNKRPFSDAEIVKKCFLAASSCMFDRFPNKEKIIQEIHKLQLSRDTCIRRCEDMAHDVDEQLQKELQTCDAWSLALDESIDETDISQLIVFVRYINYSKSVIREELLCLLPLLKTTTGKDICDLVYSYIEKIGLSWDRLVSVVTDGAPSMLGEQNGFVRLLKGKISRDIISYHCIIHQEVLCAKLNKGDNMYEVLDTVMKIINYIRGSALRHRQFKAFLEYCDSEFPDLLQLTTVRWLSRGAVLERFVALLPQVRQYLCQQNKSFPQLNDDDFVIRLFILTDISVHLNRLNKSIQGKDKNLIELYEAVSSFKDQLCILIFQIECSDFTHFPFCATLINSSTLKTQLLERLSDLQTAFNNRFQDFDKMVFLIKFLQNPTNKSHDVTSEISEQLDVQKKVIDLQLPSLRNDIFVQNLFDTNESLEKKWLSIPMKEVYQDVLRAGIKLLSMFGSTYRCEAAFSFMNFIKCKYRARLTHTHLHQLLRLSLTEFEPRIKDLSNAKQAHPSH